MATTIKKAVIAAVSEEIADITVSSSLFRTIGGGAIMLNDVGVTLGCSCGRNVNLAKDTMEEILKVIADRPDKKVLKAKVKRVKYSTLEPGKMFLCRDNSNSHSYGVGTPVMKINNNYALDIFKEYVDGMRVGNVPPPEVWEIISITKDAYDSIPARFRSLFAVEEL